MTGCLLELHGYGVSYGGKTVLRDVDLCIPERGMTVLMGPSGTGKSTLLRTLAGLNDASASLIVSGHARYRAEALGVLDRPAMLVQKPQLMRASLRENLVHELPERENLQLCQQRELAGRMLVSAGLAHLLESLDCCVMDLGLADQRLVALLRTIASNPPLLFVDEPTSGLGDEDAGRVLAFLEAEAGKRALVTILHNQKQARALGGATVLLAGGSVVESQPTETFFCKPATSLGRDFVRTGSCCAASPSTPKEDLDIEYLRDLEQVIAATKPADQSAPQGVRKIRSAGFGPRNFLWLREGEIAGTARPGLVLDLDLDLIALQRVGISVLVSLESEVAAVDAQSLGRFGITGLALPIQDMGVPSLEEADDLCSNITRLIGQGEAVALHCKAGLGRTGTMLVALLISEGMSAREALDVARNIEPRWVQSQEQAEFLLAYEKFVADKSAQQAPGYLLA